MFSTGEIYHSPLGAFSDVYFSLVKFVEDTKSGIFKPYSFFSHILVKVITVKEEMDDRFFRGEKKH